MIRDTELFGLTLGQQMDEERREAGRMYGGLTRCAVHDDNEAADYTAEIMEAIGAEHCAVCGRWYLPEDDCPLCGNCLAYENQKWQDYREELDRAHAATHGTL